MTAPEPASWDDDLELELDLPLDAPSLEADAPEVRAAVADKLSVEPAQLPLLEVRRRAIDARHHRVRFHLTVGARPDAPPALGAPHPIAVAGDPVIVVGAGPAGLYCAYQLARAGIAAIVVDRGKLVQARRRDLKGLTQHGRVDPDSNYCFGEGGAGTYSDGKLYTRAHKRGDVRDVIEVLALHGAPADILVDARPHIGSNRLPKVLTAMRERLEAVGVRFELPAKVTAILVEDHGGRRRAAGVQLADGRQLTGRAVVIATGHSARDVWPMLAAVGVDLEAKPFAVGVRIEHPQALIDRTQYGGAAGHPRLRAAAYRIAHTTDGANGPRGVFSFCMCPGGWIVPAATEPDGVVVNGMSLSRRDSPYANSGLVVAVELADLAALGLRGPLAGIELQRRIEVAAATAGGGALRAPATRVTDFVARRGSTTTPAASYVPGVTATDVGEVLAASGLDLAARLRAALPQFERQLRGYVTADAIVVGVESRTSSPVRVPRDPSTLTSPGLADLYPCGEGAGYAGGIVSAALDGVRVARAIAGGG
ncbi:MAG: NAD(P)/FAD-dependent oxidoreductase [Kofleriaceae bacterium]|nr:NAD(P)/FAD-dependent oxidoreductase [Kofleriaceae bacterium]MBP9172188.1 NAD(P)/FAD-dependent oxidoreductase [Kofleriaceae bacterium]MBP9863284.1 NAD(P)/FAD-dependent oxidoreductase [Kofleriaceae bacterium]